MANFLELQFSLDFRFSVIYSGSGTGASIVGLSHFQRHSPRAVLLSHFSLDHHRGGEHTDKDYLQTRAILSKGNLSNNS